jgi:FMN-dependent NADH-azoreductase
MGGDIMKILIIHASPRKKGVTSTLLTEVENNIASEHIVEVVRIHGLNMKPCLGCLKCRPDKTCILPQDDAHRNVTLFEYVEATPMKTIPTPQLKGKKAILVIASASPFPFHLLMSQNRGTIRALKTILNSGGIKIARVLNIPDSYNFDKKKQKYLQKARNIGISL